MISIHRRYESWKFADCETSLLQRAFFFEKSIGSSVNMFATGSVVGESRNFWNLARISLVRKNTQNCTTIQTANTQNSKANEK